MSDLTPFERGRPDIRASDAERQAVVDVLRQQYAAGRLELAEFEDRSERAFASRTRGELEVLLSDLAPPQPVRPAHRAGPPVRHRSIDPLTAYLRFWVPLSLMFILIWALSGFGYFWPMWPMFGTGIPMLFMLGSRGHER
jgi:hypothetical protein